jgi:lipopolysaccharide/colanic/teichoic acid biosynthesis glycosyltransferase
MLRDWDDLPKAMKNDKVLIYYNNLVEKKASLLVKRVYDISFAFLLVIILFPLFVIIGLIIKLDSNGPVMFRQVRVTKYGKHFRIYKFRTMINNAEKIGSEVTTKNDMRVTKVGKTLRKFRLDEIPQLFNIITGDMSFVGTRPEVVKYVEKYSEEMLATLLLPAGVTSEASIHYKNEEMLLANADNADETYINTILPEKMAYNLKSINQYSFFYELKTMIKTVLAVIISDKITDRANKSEVNKK